MDYHQIVITRAKSFYGCALKHTVEMDGLSVGVLKNGETLNAYTTAGPHTLSFLSHGKVQKSISILITPEHPITRIFVQLNVSQKLEITNETNIPHIGDPAVLEKSAHKKGKHPILGVIAIILVAIMVIGLIGRLGGSSSGGQSQSSGSSQAVELTDEEKAIAQLETATSKFQDGKYMSGIELCNKIMDEYPNTQVSANMSAYLEEQYSQIPHFSAKDIMSEYDANIVNADKQYTDTVMIVTGKVSSIGKTNNDTNLTVMLTSGTYFYGVQLNFETDQEDSVAALSEGDTISAIGKCTGKSGKQFMILDSNNVMIENCYLLAQ